MRNSEYIAGITYHIAFEVNRKCIPSSSKFGPHDFRLRKVVLFTILSFADFANYKYGILAAIDIIHNYNGC